MSLAISQIRHTVEEYLALERASEERHEYLDGQIYAMAGESPNHGDICINLIAELRTQLKGKPCRVWTKDTKVCSGPLPLRPHARKGLFSYPDLVIVCGEPQFVDPQQDVLINPKVIIEVLSPTTEAFDRGEKFRRYRTFNASLTDYVVVSQNLPMIEHFARQASGQWVIAASVLDLAGSLHVNSIDCTLRLEEVFDRVIFPPEAEEADEE